eukprot:5461457-Pyramimonas_sp.AAC.1
MLGPGLHGARPERGMRAVLGAMAKWRRVWRRRWATRGPLAISSLGCFGVEPSGASRCTESW